MAAATGTRSRAVGMREGARTEVRLRCLQGRPIYVESRVGKPTRSRWARTCGAALGACSSRLVVPRHWRLELGIGESCDADREHREPPHDSVPRTCAAARSTSNRAGGGDAVQRSTRAAAAAAASACWPGST